MAHQPAIAPPPALSASLLLQLADQLRLPLLQISRQAELQHLEADADLGRIQTMSQAALQLIDNYSLGIRLAAEPAELAVESVSVSAVLYDAGHQLDALARSYGITLELDIAGRYGPVIAHRDGLQAALVSLGAALIEALPALESRQLSLRFATHRSRYGIVAGIYSDSQQLGAKTLSQGRRLLGQSRQPLLGLTHTAGAGIFLADSILRAMRLDLRASRHHRLYGLATVLQPNPQLQLVI